MTLKQFLKAAAGIILAILINSTKLMVIVKWPLMLLFGGGGLLLAFVPFEDRPLESWIISFIKAIYSPTIFIYKRKANKNWLDLDLTKNTKQSEEDIVVGKTRSPLLGNKIKDSISVIGAKGINVEKKEENIQPIEQVQNEKTLHPVDTSLDRAAVQKEKVEEKTEDWRDQKVDLNLKTEKLGATGKVIFGAIPMPDIPEIPNVVVGMATNIEGKIVDGVIVEIQDENGNPSRVLKTNSLGQFKTTTPLADGRYLIIAEKDGYNFDRVNIDLKGQIVQPVKIIANS
ncbi:MAG: carboxypeptidase-like regulatory domain-containing protein [Candidatus Shapirobacteria bacterium]|nr:carboxypeptidase-like regulatory domain-containing protein [Candidatus Shapirobacteria bacterium]MDD4410176.1 carboxypeptidase-like regulatory domain-containing protein [Candidatus Shapirobacteria bacterium]